MVKIDMSVLVGKTVDLYGVCGNAFKIGNPQTGETVVLEAIEDPDDGYRSCLDYVELRPDETGLTFSTAPIFRVIVGVAPSDALGDRYSDGGFEGWDFVRPDTGQRVLVFGTSHADNYYPSFTFTWNPVTPLVKFLKDL